MARKPAKLAFSGVISTVTYLIGKCFLGTYITSLVEAMPTELTCRPYFTLFAGPGKQDFRIIRDIMWSNPVIALDVSQTGVTFIGG